VSVACPERNGRTTNDAEDAPGGIVTFGVSIARTEESDDSIWTVTPLPGRMMPPVRAGLRAVPNPIVPFTVAFPILRGDARGRMPKNVSASGIST
jgi:hypothetical protein